MKAKSLFEPHLVINEIRLAGGGEWTPHFRGWCFLQVKSGISYWQQAGGTQEISAGSALVVSGEDWGHLRASQLSDVVCSYFCMEPEKLTGLLSLSEQSALKKAAARENPAVRVLPPTHPVAERFRDLCQNGNSANLATRLHLLQLFVDLFASEIEGKREEFGEERDGRSRLRELLNQMAAADFVELSLADLAPKMCCSPRHLSRLFRQEVGASFREKQTELRLAKACELLATSNAKVIDVALTSGYQSNSLFSLLFKKHFGVSPGKWREKHGRKIPVRPRASASSMFLMA